MRKERKSNWASMILNDEVSANAILKRATKHYTVVIQRQHPKLWAVEGAIFLLFENSKN